MPAFTKADMFNRVGHPASSCVAANLSDTVDLTNGVCRGIHVSVDATLIAWFADDSSSVTLAVKAGVMYPYALKRVGASTTASAIFVLY